MVKGQFDQILMSDAPKAHVFGKSKRILLLLFMQCKIWQIHHQEHLQLILVDKTLHEYHI